MTSLLHLDDAGRCPSCAAVLTTARDRCPACGVTLTSPLAAQVWQVSVQAAGLLRTREQLVDRLRLEVVSPAAAGSLPTTAGTPSAHAMPAGPTSAEYAAPSGPVAASSAAPALPTSVPHGPRPEWSARKVQNLLLGLGVGLLGIAAIIFLVVSWGRLGVGGRSAVMAGVTGLAALAISATHRRGLTSTAEWLSLLTVGLALLDGEGARAAGLAGLGDVDGSLYWSGAVAVVAVLTALLAVAVPTRVLPVAAAVLSQLPVPLLGIHLADGSDRPAAVLGASLALQVVAAAAVTASSAHVAGRLRLARRVLAVGGGLMLAPAALSSTAAAYAEAGSVVSGTALLVLLATIVAAAGTLLQRRHDSLPPVVVLADPVAAGLLIAGTWAPAVDLVSSRWLATVLSVIALSLLAAASQVPVLRRTPVVCVALFSAVAPAWSAADEVTAALLSVLDAADRPWALRSDQVVVGGTWPAVAVLLLAATALVLAARLLRSAWLAASAIPAVSLAAALLVPAAGGAYPATLAAALLVASVLLVAGARLDAAGRTSCGATALGTGGIVLTLGVSWSLAVDVATLVALPVAAVALLAGALATRGSLELRPWRVVLVVAALLLVVGEAGALTRYADGGWPAVWSVALLLTAALATSAATATSRPLRSTAGDPFWSPLQATAVAVSVMSGVAAAAAVATWQDVSAPGAGLAAVVVGAVALAATAAPVRTDRPLRGVVQLAAAVAMVPALAATGLDSDRFWVGLLVAGVAVAVVATTPDRHRLGWLGGVLLAASSWARLSLADVSAPEAYTAPAGLALLVVGALRRRRDSSVGSWSAYGSGLSLVLLPSLVRAVTDAGAVRPLLLGLLALAVLAVGAVRRLQAPALLGAAVVLVDAFVQLSPLLSAAYEVVPRWVSIGVVGLLLLGAGATYEQRVRDLRRAGQRVSAMS